jgi:hypothetical protein
MNNLRPCCFCGAPANQTHISGLEYQLGYVACSKECGLVCVGAKQWNEKCEYADKLRKNLSHRGARIETLEKALRDIADYDDCDCGSCQSCIARIALEAKG